MARRPGRRESDGTVLFNGVPTKGGNLALEWNGAIPNDKGEIVVNGYNNKTFANESYVLSPTTPVCTSDP